MGIRILVVEDEIEIADFLVRGLREEGYTVEHAGDAESAEHAMATSEWDLVLLDLSLPDRNGLAVLRNHRATRGDIPVFILTAKDAVSDRVRGLDAGADDYVCKPFAFVELLARIRAQVRRPRNSNTTTLLYSDLRLDLATQRVERDGKPIELTVKEQSLLLFFLRHPNVVLTRSRIYEHVWDERYDGISNTLEVHVMELRRKLEAKGTRLIHTLRGRGYLFGEPPKGP
jgi:two-component system, OmpR family, copper resistance phosphate regulon response regulator CusR